MASSEISAAVRALSYASAGVRVSETFAVGVRASKIFAEATLLIGQNLLEVTVVRLTRIEAVVTGLAEHPLPNIVGGDTWTAVTETSQVNGRVQRISNLVTAAD